MLFASWELFAAIKWIGAAYLVWLGVRMLAAAVRRGPGATPPADAQERFGAFAKGLVTQGAKLPKSLLFFTRDPAAVHRSPAARRRGAGADPRRLVGGDRVGGALRLRARRARARGVARAPGFAAPLQALGGGAARQRRRAPRGAAKELASDVAAHRRRLPRGALRYRAARHDRGPGVLPLRRPAARRARAGRRVDHRRAPATSRSRRDSRARTALRATWWPAPSARAAARRSPTRTTSIPTALDVTTASLDAPERFPPSDHVWTSHAIPWLKLGDALPRHAKFRRPESKR